MVVGEVETKKRRPTKRMHLVSWSMSWEESPIPNYEWVMRSPMNLKAGKSLLVSFDTSYLSHCELIALMLGGSQILTPEVFLSEIQKLS